MCPTDFISTVAFGPGAAAEEKVWGYVRQAFGERDVLGFWRFPAFARVGGGFKEPDILLADRDWGLIVIEVKAYAITDIHAIHGHDWEVGTITPNPRPYQQARQQLDTLLHYSRMEPVLDTDVTGRAMVALPNVSRAEWEAAGFDRLPSCPPILFRDDLAPARLAAAVAAVSPLGGGRRLTDGQWPVLLAVLGGRPAHRRVPRERPASATSRASVLAQLRERLFEFDAQQARIGYTAPPGAQRIRGIAGSGKTVLLCQRAARMHLEDTTRDIAYVFFTRSLYHHIEETLNRWLRFFSGGVVGYDDARHKLRVLHAWGGANRPGLYSVVAKASGERPLTVKDVTERDPSGGLAEACLRLLRNRPIAPVFDVVLIDEGQDLVVDDRLKHDDRQAIYALAYESLRPVSPDMPDERRLIWAYDEAQSLDTLKIPTAREVFGEGLATLFVGKHRDGSSKSEIMRRCYRTPGPILTAAHALGMGLLRPDGMLSGLTTQDGWRDIGYEVEGKFLSGHEVTLKRPAEHSPNAVDELWDAPLFEFAMHQSRADEFAALADNLRQNLGPDGLEPSREMLVLVLGDGFEGQSLQRQTAHALMEAGIDVYVPSALGPNQLDPKYPNHAPDKFWHDGAVTVSLLHRAKGNEADMVHVVGFDRVALKEDDIRMRNQLFVALSRSRAWVSLSGAGDHPMNDEVRRVLDADGTYRFTFKRPPRRELAD